MQICSFEVSNTALNSINFDKLKLTFKGSDDDIKKNISLDRTRRDVLILNSKYKYELIIQSLNYKTAALFYTKLIELHQKGLDFYITDCDLAFLRMFFPNNDDVTAENADTIDLYFEFDLSDVDVKEKVFNVDLVIPLIFTGNVG